MSKISKRFPGVTALSEVDFDVRPGEVHVLFGENGAGKSSLINIIAGTFAPTSGTVHFKGVEVVNPTPAKARALGISSIFQEFSLVPSLTVEENLFLGRELSRYGVINKSEMHAEAQRLIERLGFDLPLSSKVGDLSRAHQQMAEIAKALLTDVRLLILDEPTASLTEKEAERLFDLIGALKAEGVGIIYVSHRMREIKRLADRITVLRDGRHIATVDAQAVSDNGLIELMTGRKVDMLFPHIAHAPGRTRLEVQGLTLADGAVRGASFYARAGEITGIAGLVGCGKSELVRAVYGLEPITSGRIIIDGQDYCRPTPAEGLSRKVAYFPADRVAEGLALSRPIRENASMSSLDTDELSRTGVLKKGRERDLVSRALERLQLRPPDPERKVGNLSGGNRQKVMLARGLLRDTEIFMFDEPTVGIDVGAKREVYEFMRSLVEAGAMVVLVSSELPEVLNLSKRVYVMHQGTIAAELEGEQLTEHNVLKCFFPVAPAGATSQVRAI